MHKLLSLRLIICHFVKYWDYRMKINPILKKEWLRENQAYIKQSKVDFELILHLIELIESDDWNILYTKNSKSLSCRQVIDYVNKVDFNNQSTISVVYIVKNEQNTILKSIKSLKKLADEIIVVDTGSTDKTIEILTNYSMNDTSINLYSFEWCDDFSRARNFANSKASCDWIVSLDADERITNFKLLKLLLTYLKNFGDYPKTVFNLNIIRDDNAYKTGKVIQNLSCFSYRGRVHETYFSSVGDVHYTNINIDIISQNRMTLKKADYYNKLLLLTIDENPMNLRWLYFYLRDNFNSIEYTEMKTLCYDSLYNDSLSRNLKGSYYSVRITLLLMFKALQNKRISDFEKYQYTIKDVACEHSDYIFLKYAFKLLKIQEIIGNELEEMLNVCQKLKTENSIFPVDYLYSVLATYLLLEGEPQKSKNILEELFNRNSDFPCFLTNSMREFLLRAK